MIQKERLLSKHTEIRGRFLTLALAMPGLQGPREAMSALDLGASILGGGGSLAELDLYSSGMAQAEATAVSLVPRSDLGRSILKIKERTLAYASSHAFQPS